MKVRITDKLKEEYNIKSSKIIENHRKSSKIISLNNNINFFKKNNKK